jgi:hypothetical protein
MLIYTKEYICVFVPDDIVPQIHLLSSMDPVDPVPPILDICEQNLKRIIIYCEHFLIEPMREIYPPIYSNQEIQIYIQEWYIMFIEYIPSNELIEFMCNVRYMNVEPLYKLIISQLAKYVSNTNILDCKLNLGL